MGEATYQAAIVRPLSRWLKLVPSEKPFRLPLMSAEGGKVLFIQSGSMTDILYAAPLITGLHRAYPNCRIGVLVDESASELIRHHPHVHDLLLHRSGHGALSNPRLVKTIRDLRKRSYDLVIHMNDNPGPTHRALGYYSGAPVRVGPCARDSYPYINCELRWDTERAGYEGNRLKEVAGLLGIGAAADPLSSLLTEQDIRFARQLVHFRKPRRDQILIGVDPGVGKSQIKVLDRTLAYLLNAIYKRYRSKVIILATPSEDAAATRFENSLQCERIDLPRHNVKDVVSLLSQCDLFLGGNTDLLHFAVAFGIPTLGLFTEKDDPRWIPNNTNHVAVIEGRKGIKLSLTDFMESADRLLALPKLPQGHTRLKPQHSAH